jgi:hypothetical protein
MKVLISCTENPKNFIEVLDDLELFIDKKVILDEKNFPLVSQPSAAAAPSVSKFCNSHNFSYQPRHFFFTG